MLFKLTIPRDVRFVPTVRQVAERVAQCAGYTAAEAAAVAAAVAHAANTVLAQPVAAGPRPGDSVDLRFDRDGSHLDVWLHYRDEGCDRPVVDPALSSEALRRGMDSVEFGRQGDVTFCRLRRALPSEKANHKCELPPR